MTGLSLCEEVKHQFDRENEVSLEQLFRSFCNHVTLGQWELAGVCLRGLYKKRKQLDKPLKEILRALIDQPKLVSNGSPSVISPFHLSWLCLVEYLDLFTAEEDKLPAPIEQTVEFHLLLYVACKTAPKQIIQELDNYHCQIIYGDTSHLTSDAAILSTSCLHYLQNLLDDDPLFGHALICQLSGHDKHLLEANQNLQQLYINCITTHLTLLQSGCTLLADGGDSTLTGTVSNHEGEKTLHTFSKHKDHIYQLLSLINPTPAMTALSEALDSLFEKLIKRTKITDKSSLDKGTLYSCLMQRPDSTFLIEKFCDIEKRMRLPLDGEFGHALGVSKEMLGRRSPVVSPIVPVCLFQSYVTQRTDAWKFLYFHSMNKNHILDNIVETALLLIKDGDFDKVNQLLSPPEFKVLKPLVLLLGWSYCYSCENARHLLDALWDNQAQVCDPLLYQACQKLAYQVQLVQWCLEKAGPLLASSESGSTHHQQASEMFQGLESHSVLHVLHKSISLKQLPEEEVFSLLKKRPVFSPATLQKGNNQEELPGVKGEETESRDMSDTSPERDVFLVARGDETKCVHPEVERDLILYHSFCGLKNFMECISFCIPNKFDNEQPSEVPIQLTASTSNNNLVLSKKLQEGREHLTYVFPLAYRVEILEDIFSLLFATYEDLYEEKTYHDSDDLDTGDDETKSQANSWTGSMESLQSTASTTDTASAAEWSGIQSPFQDQERPNFAPPVLASTPESPAKIQTHGRQGSRGSKKQLFQSIKPEFDHIPILEGEKRPAENSNDQIQRIRSFSPLIVDKTKAKEFAFSKKGKHPREQQDLSDEEPKIGFIASDEIIAPYLNVIKDCLMDLNTAKIRQTRSGKSDIRNSPDWLRSSVVSSTLEQRASRLGQYITEAQWRHQLVSWTDTSRVLKSRRGGRKYQHKRGRDTMEEEAVCASDEDEDKEGKLKGDQIKGSDDFDARSEESSSYQSQEVTTGTEDTNGKTKVRQKRSKRPRQTRRASVSEGLVVKDDSTVARMLSSPQTLIFMCMRKDSYDRAQQVIKMFEMHTKPSAQSAIFAEKYTNSFRELSRMQPKPRQSTSRRSSAPSRTLGAVAMAAASGVTSSVVSNLIDELLTTPNLASILLPDVDCDEEAVKKSLLFKFVSPELIPVMVCLDLACTANVSWDMCKSLVETAYSRLVQPAEDSSSKSDIGLVGVINMLTELGQLLVPPTSDEKIQTKLRILQSSKPNLVDLLSSIRPINYESRENSWKRTCEQEQSMKKMEQALEEGDTVIARVEDVASRGKAKTKATGSLTSFKLIEKTLAVRVALTELQKSFDCVSGVDDVLGEGTRNNRLDYIRTLVYHVDTLATLLLYWQTTPDDLPEKTTRGVLMKASNPFVVLNKGIAETLGKPMFERSVSPKRLEGICKQLNINLVKVIVHNCCPHIPASGLNNSKVYRFPESEPTVLNDASQWLEKAREPNVVAKELLNKMIDLFTDVAQSNDGLVDARSAAVIIKSPEFHAIVQGTGELQKVDLDQLQSNESKICFFINVLNLLFAHASLLHFSKNDNEEDWELNRSIETRHRSLSRLSRTSSISDFEDLWKPRGVSALDRIAFLKHHCYDIGQTGPTSAFDILFVILRAGIPPPTMFGPAIQLCYPERPADDPKRRYKLSIPDRRIVFAICDGCISSPDLQVYDVQGLETQLNAAVTTYINPRIGIDVAVGKIVLPELLYWYKNDFYQGPLNDLNPAQSQSSPQEQDISYLLQLEPFLLPNTANQLQAVLSSVKEVAYRPFCWTFGYKFEISNLDRSDSSSNLQRSSSAPDSLYLSMEYSTSSLRCADTRGRFSPNKATLEYLSKASPLIYTLTELVCVSKGDQNLRNSRNDVLSQENLPEPQPGVRDKSPSRIPNESLFNTILQRSASFPALQRYLVSRFYCLSELLRVVNASESDSVTSSYEFIRLDSKVSREDIDEFSPQLSLSSLALSNEDACEQQYACQKTSDYYFRQGNFDVLLELISTSCFHGDGSGSSPVDFLLTSAVLSKGGVSNMFVKRLDAMLSDLKVPSIGFTHKWQKKPCSLLARVKENDQLAQLVLSKMREYKAKDASDMLKLARSRPPRNTALRKELEYRTKELNLHVKIARCAKTHQYKTTDTNAFALLTQWQGVAVATPEEPEHVMNFLLSIQQYELAEDWAMMHGLPHTFHKAIKESHLKHLLESSPEDTMKAYRILEGIQEQHMALEVCDSLLKQNLHVSQTLFIIQFMLTNLHPHLSPIRIEELLLTKMGAKALLCIPDTARPAYEHLVSRPNLLLEQLLMNLKVEWAARVFHRLQVDLTLMEDESDDEGARHHGCTVKDFDSLLARYAAKALEFQVVQPETTQETSTGSQGIRQVLSSSPSPSTSSFGGRNIPIPTSGRETPIPRKEKTTDQEYGHGILQRSISSITADTPKRADQQSYLPPAIPPQKEEWMPDEQVLECIICKEQFSMFNRRHHCRRCGRVVCGTCSKHSSVVQGFGKTPVRVCDTCYERFYDKKLEKETTESAHFSPASKSPAPQGGFDSLERNVAQDSIVGSYGNGAYEVQTDARPVNKWKLSLEPENNISVREEFNYEQAPSSSLCIAILDLHSDNSVCGRLLMDLCNTLSKKLVPITPGVRNEEVDHNLIISMIRYLLFNAKLKMIKTGETQGIELCDTYLGHVELMKFLVESNCGDIPSLQDLIHPDSARRLRDRFIEDERLALAMEVSTKCGLDSSGVWAAAGFACLRAGDFGLARDKFAKCMKPAEGKQQQNSQYLDKVLDILQNSPLISFSQSTDELLSPLRGLAEHCKSVPRGSVLDSKRFDECLYYLHAYGNDAAIVAFYVRHGNVRLACRYILEKKSSPDVFVESLLMRLVSKGNLTTLKEQLEIADPSLQSWMIYLTAACRYLHKRGYHHLLYDLQLFMKDYFRAAQTCIRFFEGAAGGHVSSYEDLFSRVEYLTKARAHIETVIIEKKSPRGSALSAGAWLRSHGSMRRRSQDEMQHVTITLSDLNNHVNTINLQVEVTNFIHNCLVEGTSASMVDDDAKLSTLFGNGHARAELAIQVLLSGSTIQDGFSLASRIIQDYNLPASRIYVDAGRALARQYRFVQIQQLLKCVGEVGLVSDKCHDEIILACVRIVSADPNQAKQVENLIKLLRSDTNKIDAFLLCGKLKSAYLIAVREKNVEAIQLIAEEAQKTGQSKTLNLCKKWLAQNQKINEAEKRVLTQRRGDNK